MFDNGILSRKAVSSLTGLSYSTLWREVKRGNFPCPVRISVGRVGWVSSDIQNWLKSRRGNESVCVKGGGEK